MARFFPFLVEGIATMSKDICTDGDVTMGQQIRVVVKYLEDHPEELNKLSAVLIEKSLSKAFPCKK
jgi:hypothetical protein